MEDKSSDPDFLSLLEEFECSTGHDEVATDKTIESSPLLDFLLEEDEALPVSQRTTTLSVNAFSSASHAERCRLNRKRKKQELLDLRSTVTTLEATLAKLTQPQTSSDRDDQSWDALSWRELSRRRKLESCKAFAENKLLRELLVKQWGAAQQIQQAIRSVPKVETTDSTPRYLKRPREETAMAMAASSRGMYHELFQKIHSSYEKEDFREELSWIKIGVRKISMDVISQAGGSTDTSIRVLECQRLPFSLSYVRDATWRHLSSSCDKPSSVKDTMCGQSSLTSLGDDMFGECGGDCNTLPGDDEIPAGRLAIRRYVEANRLTFVWECDGCFQCDGFRRPIGRVTERGWCVVESSEDNPTSSVFRIQVHYVPHASEHSATECCSSRTTLSSDMALDLYQCTIARTFGDVERQVFHVDNQKCERKL
ncbi:hypothetical protein PINS_up008758 [Pythium insidiosum]|nr:hypothetical protein PINS_up008758 [Pythium insidiosum]